MKVSIVDGDERLFRAAAFGMPDRASIEQSYDRLESFARNLSSRAREGLGRAREMIDLMYNEDVHKGLRVLDRSARGMYRRDVIQFLDSQEEIALAPMEMRRWILANPRIRNLFDSQSIDGWGAKQGAFDLPEKGVEDPFWTAMRNGETKKDAKGAYYCDFTYGTEDMTGKKLSSEEQLDLIATMDIVLQTMDDGIDPTSILAEKL